MHRGKPVVYGRTGGRSDGEGSEIINSVGFIVLALALVVALGGVDVTHHERVRLQAVAGLTALAGVEQLATTGWEDAGEWPYGTALAVVEASDVSVQFCEIRNPGCLVILTQPVEIAGFSTNVSVRARVRPER